MTKDRRGGRPVGTGVFVIGTDTGCGKTEVSLGLMRRLRAEGVEVLGMKPVASGSEPTPAGWRNPDALRLRKESSRALPYETINPYAFSDPVAPHIAAAKAGALIDFKIIEESYRRLVEQADCVIVEGVGGWRVPLGPNQELPDLVCALGLPVVLVVGVRLGCINHSLLTVESILGRGLDLIGWVANLCDPDMLEVGANLEALETRIPAPCLGRVPVLKPVSPDSVARYLSWPALRAAQMTSNRRGAGD